MTWTRGDAQFDERAARIVGRSDARIAFARWADEAWIGRLRVVTIVGEPGIGKSALVDHAVTQWAHEGAHVLTATCYEDLSVPYLPLLTAMHSAAGLDERGHKSLLTRADQIPDLFVTLADDLISHATTTRVILRVDDLHWIDPASTELLGHMLATASSHSLTQPLTLLVVITTRTLDPSGPAGRLVERLQLETAYREIAVGPLDELEVNELLERILERRVSRGFLEEVLEATDGNPLRIRVLIEHLERAGALELHNGEVVAIGDVNVDTAGFSEVILAQLEALTKADRDLLLVAALMGNELDAEDLRHVAGLGTSEMDQCLDSLEIAGLLLERPDGTLQFKQSFVRSMLARSRSIRARRELHLHIAQRIAERVEGPHDLRALEVAHHLRRAGPRAPADQILHYARVAADQSTAMGAWAKAARYAELALAALDVTSQVPYSRDEGGLSGRATEPTSDRIELHLTAAQAHFRNHDAAATFRHCEALVPLAQATGNHDAWGRGLILAARTRLTLTGDIGADLDEFGDLADFVRIGFIESAFECSPEVEARSWQLLAEIAMAAGDLDRSAEATRAASRVAERSGNPVLVAELEFAVGLGLFAALEPVGAIAHFERSIAAAKAGGDEWIVAWGMGRLVLTNFLAGHVRQSIIDAESTIEHCRRTHHWAEHGLVTAGAASAQLSTGDLAGAEKLARAAIASHARSSFPYIPGLAWPILAYTQALRLDRAGAQQSLANWAAASVRGAARFQLLIDALTLPTERFAAAVDLTRYLPSSRAPMHAFTAGGLAVDVEVGARLGDGALLERALERLNVLQTQAVVLLLPVGASVDRLRGMALFGLGDIDRSIAVLDAAADDLRRRGALVEALRCDVERCIVSASVDVASIGLEAEALAAELARRSLLSLRSRLSEALPDVMRATARLNRTVVAWDMVESTPMLIRQGDVGYIDLIHELNELIDVRLAEHHGVAFKYTGDGVYAWFLDNGDALRCARAVRDDLRVRNVRVGVQPIVMRTGIAVGQPIDDDGDLFGLTVVVASRLCAQALDDQVLCTVEVAQNGGRNVAVSPVGDLRLKGVADLVATAELVG